MDTRVPPQDKHKKSVASPQMNKRKTTDGGGVVFDTPPQLKNQHDAAPSWLVQKSEGPKKTTSTDTLKNIPQTKTSTEKKVDGVIAQTAPPLRTLKDDLARIIAEHKVSATDVAVKEQQRRLQQLADERTALELKKKLQLDQATLASNKAREIEQLRRGTQPPARDIPVPQRQLVSEAVPTPSVRTPDPIVVTAQTLLTPTRPVESEKKREPIPVVIVESVKAPAPVPPRIEPTPTSKPMLAEKPKEPIPVVIIKPQEPVVVKAPVPQREYTAPRVEPLPVPMVPRAEPAPRIEKIIPPAQLPPRKPEPIATFVPKKEIPPQPPPVRPIPLPPIIPVKKPEPIPATIVSTVEREPQRVSVIPPPPIPSVLPPQQLPPVLPPPPRIPPAPVASTQPRSKLPPLVDIETGEFIRPTYEAGELAKQVAEVRGAPYTTAIRTKQIPSGAVAQDEAILRETIPLSSTELELRRRIEEIHTRGDRAPGRGALRTIMVSLFLIILGGGVLGGIYYFTKTTPAPKTPLQIGTLVFADVTKTIPIGSVRGDILRGLLLAKANETVLTPNKIAHLQMTVPLGEGAREVTTQEWFDYMEVGATSALVRSLHPQFMLGLHAEESTDPFLVFKTSFYENAFAGMLLWENTLAEDLSPLFGIPTTHDELSTSTPSLAHSRFKDRLINNRDARVLLDEYGDIVLLYSFIDSQTLVITTGRETFLEILNRVQSTRTER